MFLMFSARKCDVHLFIYTKFIGIIDGNDECAKVVKVKFVIFYLPACGAFTISGNC